MSGHTTIPQSDWQWFGTAGHFIASEDCRFHLATQVGRVLVSTIGDYKPKDIDSDPLRVNHEGFREIGWQRFYETYVFRLSDDRCPCGCGAPKVAQWNEIDSRGWQSRAEANRGHLEMCEKWAAVDQDAAIAEVEAALAEVEAVESTEATS